MSDELDLDELTSEPAPTLASDDEFPPPDHTANDGSADVLSVVDRVKARAKSNGKATREPKAPKERKPLPPKRAGQLVKPLTELYTSLGMMFVPFDPTCGTVIIDNAAECAKRLDLLAQENESVRRALHALTSTSAWGGVLIAHLPIMLVLMMHHGPENVAERVAPVAMMVAPNAYGSMMQNQNPGAHEAAS